MPRPALSHINPCMAWFDALPKALRDLINEHGFFAEQAIRRGVTDPIVIQAAIARLRKIALERRA